MPVTTASDVPVAAPEHGFPIVGIGASAGGLAAIESFFSSMPADADPGMAFVLVQHLDPNHKSILTELVRRYTRMEVSEVEDGMVVHPNCVYIIPPNFDMAFLNGTLQLLTPAAPRGHRLPIDFFFQSLARDQHERAIGIVLSGTGCDGSLGVRAIKGEGGMVMAQDPDSAEFDGMPRSAIATGMVDYKLPPKEMPPQLTAYATHAFGRSATPGSVQEPKAESAMKKLFLLLRNQTGHDFSQYKPSTIRRRIERRMAVSQIESIDEYFKFARQSREEVDALFRDMLIGVTGFFRDPAVFQAIEEQIIPRLFAGKSAVNTIRVWSAGCSTGEEAYSLAILLAEKQELLKRSFRVQVFATDIDSQAIATARLGLYPASIAADISPERLERFFSAEPDGLTYRIHKGIRDMLVFSEQSVIKDPPFSKLDLLCCRNLLIYMGDALQDRIIPLFHYALKPGGFLVLGTSETVGGGGVHFVAMDRKLKLYQRKGDFRSLQRGVPDRFALPETAIEVAMLPGGMVPRVTSAGLAPPVQAKTRLRERTEQALLQQVAPSAALVNRSGDILYLHGRTGMYLEPAVGEVGGYNILKMAREGLRRELAMTLHKAAETRGIVRHLGLRVKTNGHFTTVNLTVRPAGQDDQTASKGVIEESLYLVILEEAPDPVIPDPAAVSSDPVSGDAGARIASLQRELQDKDEYAQSTIEELETAAEELKSTTEEMQSVNEELQSTNEELETSKEEMQSINEELATVNTELQAKVADLSRVNNDMNNLLSGSGIATLFVDLQLRILRFTPATTAIINLLPVDVGRPMAHFVSNLTGYDRLLADTQVVLDTLIPAELEVQARLGAWYTLRIQPYRTTDNVIEGAVLTFVNITEQRRTAEALRKANELARLAVVVRDAHDAITVQDLEGRIIAWNPGAVQLYGWSEAEALTMNIRDRVPEPLRQGELAKAQQLSRAAILEPYRTRRITKAGALLDVWMTATALVDETGRMYAIATTERAQDRNV
ncbi:MAG: chemotaxis protein CheB [bacterium]